MNIARLVRALEKAGLKVIKTDTNEYKKQWGHYDGPFWHYYCEGPTHKCDFWPNGYHDGEDKDMTTCSVQVMRKNERNDSQSDYFPGCFHRTIKSVVAALK